MYLEWTYWHDCTERHNTKGDFTVNHTHQNWTINRTITKQIIAIMLFINKMLFIGLYYVKDSAKRAKCRYNHQTGFRRKMLQYKTSTKDDVILPDNHHWTEAVSVCYYTWVGCHKDDGYKVHWNYFKWSLGQYTNMCRSSRTIIIGNHYTFKKKSSTPENSNNCQKCWLKYGTKMDDSYNSLWVNCNIKKCTYWVHLKCLGFFVKDDDNKDPIKNLYFLCPAHQEKQPTPKNILRKKL